MDMRFFDTDKEQVEFGNLIPIDDEPVEEAFDSENKEEIYIDTNRPIDDDGLFDNTLETKTEVDEDWGWQDRTKKVLEYAEEDIPAIKDYLIHCYPDETAGYESADIEDALYGLNKESLPLKGVELPFVFEMIEFDEDGDDIDDFTEGYPRNDDEVYINASVRKHLNSICQKYCGWKEPKDIRPLWDELVEAGVDPIMVSGYPTSIAPDGGRSWEISFTMNDKPVRNSLFIYSVYESDGDSLKNEYNIYFS